MRPVDVPPIDDGECHGRRPAWKNGDEVQELDVRPSLGRHWRQELDP